MFISQKKFVLQDRVWVENLIHQIVYQADSIKTDKDAIMLFQLKMNTFPIKNPLLSQAFEN